MGKSQFFFSLRLGVSPLFPPVVRSVRNRFSFLALSISSTLRTKGSYRQTAKALSPRPPRLAQTSRMKTFLPRPHFVLALLLLCLLLLPPPSQQGSVGTEVPSPSSGTKGGAAGANRTEDASPTVCTTVKTNTWVHYFAYLNVWYTLHGTRGKSPNSSPLQATLKKSIPDNENQRKNW